jgi:uncharacterized protein
MQNKNYRIIIDTNLWISFLISKTFAKLDYILTTKQAVLLFSEELMHEFLDVTQRPKFRKFFNEVAKTDLIAGLEEHAKFIKVKSKMNLCRDSKDNFLLDLAKDSKANFLFTGDKDLLDLQNIGQTKIITITDFINNY